MVIALSNNKKFVLITEKVRNEWWVELINRASGKVRILYCKNKKVAMGFQDVSINKHIELLDSMDVEEEHMYKKNVHQVRA